MIALQQIGTGPCLPYFGKWISFGETCMPLLTAANNCVWASTAGGKFSWNWIATDLHDASSSNASKKIDRIHLSRKNCECLAERFLTTKDTLKGATKCFKNMASTVDSDNVEMECKEDVTVSDVTTPDTLAKSPFPRSWKKQAIVKKSNKENNSKTLQFWKLLWFRFRHFGSTVNFNDF